MSMDLSFAKVLFFKDYQPAHMDEEGHYVFEMKNAPIEVPIMSQEADSAPNEEEVPDLQEIVDSFGEKSREKRRSPLLPSADLSSPSGNVTAYVMHDPLQQMIIHWAGKNSSAIVVLTKDVSVEQLAKKSNVYFSHDYGKSFQKVSSIKKPISKFYHAPSDINRYIFVDIQGRTLYTTYNMGKSFNSVTCPFKPTYLSIHPTRASYVIGYEKEMSNTSLWLSKDFGQTWHSIQSDVKKAYWGYSQGNDFDHLDALYVERHEPGGKISVLKSQTFFRNDLREQVLISSVDEFVIRNNSLFAVRSGKNGDNNLLITLDRHSAFVVAKFPTREPKKEFFVIDVAENQIMVLVSHGLGRTDLYISEPNKVDFTFSLSNVTYYNPNGVGSTQQLLVNQNSAFADIHKVKGLRSIFIANTATVVDATQQYNMSDMKTVISFDKGVIWEDVPPPRVDSNGKTICGETKCSLHLLQDFHSAHWSTLTSPIMSEPSAPGYILAAGSVGSKIVKKVDVFFSSNGGKNWKEIRKGEWYYDWADHGGVLAMVKKFGKSSELFYSLDEGDTWDNVTFYSEPINVYGLMTEPGETTTIFTVFGSSNDGENSWIIVQVDLKWAFHGRVCRRWDYRSWSPEDENGMSCLLGTKVTYKRKHTYYGGPCYNGKNFDRPTSVRSCHCSRFDFECGRGFYLAPNSHSMACIPDPNSNVDPYEIPPNCRSGSSYKRTRGYQKIPGDKCKGGDADSHYGPVDAMCPIIDEDAFLLITTSTGISRINLENDKLEHLPVTVNIPSGIKNIEYDYDFQCFYFTSSNSIERVCMNGALLQGELSVNKTIVTESGDISVMAIDWDSKNIYWGTSSPAAIKVMRLGTKVKMLGSAMSYTRKLPLNETFLHYPTSLALHPVKGYLYYVDKLSFYSGTKIVRARMDGTNATMMTFDYSPRWYTSLTVDVSSNRLYFISKGSYFTKIASLDLDTPHYQHSILYDSDVRLVATFKNFAYYWRVEGDVQRADKFEIHDNHTLALNLKNVGVIKVVRRGLQIYHNKCGNKTDQCRQLCIPVPNSDETKDADSKCYCDNVNYMTPEGNGTCDCRIGEILTPEGQCEPNATSCIFHQFRCSDGKCIPDSWLCDHAKDCVDGEDEHSCYFDVCKTGYQKCASSSLCIKKDYFCDGEVDCVDGSDEKGCIYACDLKTHFKCHDSNRCINKTWVCDGDYDCNDLSDETNCSVSNSCLDTEMACSTIISANDCIPSYWICDSHVDCLNGADEANCSATCTSDQFSCGDGTCIKRGFKCDGYNDCKNGNDEKSCPHTTRHMVTTTSSPFHRNKCSISEMKCNGDDMCIPLAWKCDGANDCGDHSDEFDCGRPANGTGITHRCRSSIFQYRCNHGDCILAFFECDGDNDCGDWSDEKHCPGFNGKGNHPGCFTGNGLNYQGTRNYTKSGRACQRWSSNHPHIPHYWPVYRNHSFCRNPDNDGYGPWCYTTDVNKRWEYCGIPRCMNNGSAPTGVPPTAAPRICQDGLFQCTNGKCIHDRWTCDQENDCDDGSDELYCNSTCNTNELRCNNGRCVLQSAKCDGTDDCKDNTDEDGCPTSTHLPCDPITQFRCKDVFQCIPKSSYCNGIRDCRDFSDENCNTTGTTVSPLGTVSCFDGRGSVRTDSVCDYRPDCKDLSDEKNCAYHAVVAFTKYSSNCPKDSKKACQLIGWRPPLASFPAKYKDDLKYIIHYEEDPGYIDMVPERVGQFLDAVTAPITKSSALLRDLKWFTKYIVHVTIGYKNLSLPAQTRSHLRFTTLHGVPDAPTSVEARVIVKVGELFDVKIKWKSRSEDVSGFYVKIQYQGNQQSRVQWVRGDRYSPKRVTVTISSGVASVSVLATNFYHNSTWSKPAKLVISDLGRPVVTAAPLKKYQCKLSWKSQVANSSIFGYKIRTMSSEMDTRYDDVNVSTARTYILQKLRPNTLFRISVAFIAKTDFQVGPYSKEAECTPSGPKALSPILQVLTPVTITSIKITWSPATPADTFFEISWNEGMEPPFNTKTVSGNSTVITNLPPNTKQMFRIRVVKPYIGKYSYHRVAKPLFDFDESVRNLHVHVDPNHMGGEVLWKRPTDSSIQGLGYTLKLYNGGSKTIRKSFDIPKTTDGTMHYHINSLTPGNTYTVTVATSNKGSNLASYTFVMGKVPGPIARPAESEGLHTGRYKVVFHMNDDYKHFYNSESVTSIHVHLCNGAHVKSADNSNNCTAYPDVDISEGAVRFSILYPGKYTLLLQPVCHKAQECASSSLEVVTDDLATSASTAATTATFSRTTVIAIVIPAAVVVLALLTAVVVLQIRKRRLAEAYRGFVASHYDPQSGEAVFMSNDDDDTGLALDDDQDVETPLITGFADDEPLIVA